MNPENPKIYVAIHAVMEDLAKVGIGKNATNDEGQYKARGIEEVVRVLGGLLIKHRLIIIPRAIKRDYAERGTQRGGAITYVCVECEFDLVSVEDGSIHTGRGFGEAMDESDKATAKAQTGAWKYFVLQCFCVPVEGQPDADLHTPKATSKGIDKDANISPMASVAVEEIQKDKAAAFQIPPLAANTDPINPNDVQEIRQLLVEKNINEDEAVHWASKQRTKVMAELTVAEGVKLWNAYNKKK